LRKGDQVVVHLSDLHVETYEGSKGTGTKLVGRVDDVELVSGQQPQGHQQAPRQAAPRQAPQPVRQQQPQYADDDDDIPF
jgi:single-stranded DNA-binding protein